MSAASAFFASRVVAAGTSPARDASRAARAAARPRFGEVVPRGVSVPFGGPTRSPSLVRSASADQPAHAGIVDESCVHGSSLVSTGLAPSAAPLCEQMGVQGVHHVAVIVQDMKRSMDFYHRMLGFPVNPDRPNDKLPYDGAWLMMGPEMIHLMELPNPDPSDLDFRPSHGGKDRHFCIGVKNLKPLTDALEKENVPYTASRSGRPAIFFRDPDCNTLEVVQGLEWRDENDRNLTLP
jgi:catechol 2,3-dioxygenase-like lactoylglutathione lyase family enzyme